MRRVLVVGGAALAICLSVAAGASAATQVGDPCVAGEVSSYSGTITFFPMLTPQSPFPAAVPSTGVITSWGMNVASGVPGFSSSVAFKVMRADPPTLTAQVVGEDRETITSGSNLFNVRIPVRTGDFLGMSNDGHSLIYCKQPSVGSTIGVLQGDPTTGSTVTFEERHEEEGRIPVFATVEPDADGDGYGDETQDKCPTDASTHEACPAPKAAPAPPAPPAPITLSDSAAAKKGLVTVSLTSSAQATVTLGGTVKLGKGKTAKLSGGTQIVAPGALAKFTVVFPAKLKTALKQLSTSKKLSLILTATAPGATTTNLTVKVPGELKPVPKHHHGK
jgi:hypothetical protein